MRRAILFAEVPQLYASIERSDDPALRERPVLVGGDPRKRGLVQAATLDALAAGVELEMPVVEALRLCPSARALRTDMRRYREVSRRLFASLRGVHPWLEPSGLGGAWLDVTGAGRSPEAMAEALVARVAEEPGLPLRVGIASTKAIARLAAEEAGDRGVYAVAEGAERQFLDPLPVTRLEGVGQKTAARLAELGVQQVAACAALGRERLEELFGPHGLRIFALASGADDAPVRASRHAQSLSREATLRAEVPDVSLLGEQLQRLAQELDEELRRQGLAASQVSLRLRYADGVSASRTQTLGTPVAGAAEIAEVGARLLARLAAGSRPIRGLGIQVGKLAPGADRDRQLELFRPGS